MTLKHRGTDCTEGNTEKSEELLYHLLLSLHTHFLTLCALCVVCASVFRRRNLNSYDISFDSSSDISDIFNSSGDMDRETLEIVRAFAAESLDSLDEQEGKIQDIAESGTKESVHSIFRVFHTIKGLSGFLSFNTINTVTHEAETMLDLVRSMKTPPGDEVIDVIYEAFDVLRTLLNVVSTSLKDTGHEIAVRNLVGHLQTAIQNLRSGKTASAPRLASDPPAKPREVSPQPPSTKKPREPLEEKPLLHPEEPLFSSDEMQQLTEPQRILQTETTQSEPTTTAPKNDEQQQQQQQQQQQRQQHYEWHEQPLLAPATPEMVMHYVAEATDLITRAENNCLRLEQEPENISIVIDIFGAVHSLKGNSGFMGFAEIEDMSMDLENILDAVRNKQLEVYPGLISMLLTNVDIIKRSIQSLVTSIPFGEEPQMIAANTVSVAMPVQMPSQMPSQAPAQAPAQAQQSAPPVPPVETHFANGAADVVVTNDQHQHHDNNNDNDNHHDAPPEIQAEAAPATAVSPALAQRRDIRVDMEKLDKLFDLVGELITIESMVTSNPDVIALEILSFTKAAGMLNKITRELQEVTMSIRMTPLEGLFNKMKRLVRDLSLRFDKKIQFEIIGAETEMDKNVIEEVSDPLMHIIRNAIDHGVEKREQRLAAGKTDTGTIKLQARYEGNEILIIVEDDGGGLNKKRILEKAISKGLVKVPVEKLTDRDIIHFVFEPGFSTADKVSDISGRGVGMDVVKRNIEKLQGSITVDSREGMGSRFTLRIPLTLAIIEGMLIRVGTAVYALPILTIRESFRPSPEAITITMDGQEIVRVREELFPVIRLHEVYDCPPGTSELTKGILIIVESRQKTACLFVDDILGQQQIVVKGLSDYVGNVKGVTGCMILSNGEIGLIADVDMLLSMMAGTSEAAY
jgi:two-component system, chemotaxis family, sensor kinase CheA